MSFLYQPKTKTGESIKFPQIFAKCLIGNGAWPTEGDANDFWFQMKSKLYNLYGWMVFFNLTYLSLCEMGFFIANMTDIFKAVESFCTSMIALFIVVRTLHFRLATEKLKKVLEIFAKDIWIDGEKYPRVIRKCNRVLWPVFGYFISLFIVLIIYAVLPIYVFYSTNQTMKSTDKLVPYPMIFPYDVQKSVYYVITYISTVFSGYVIVAHFYAHDAILLMFISYLCGQFEILHSDVIRLIPECHAEWQKLYGADAMRFSYDVQSDAGRIKLLQGMYNKRLHELSARHSDLIRFCAQANDLISFPLLVNVVNSTFLICFCGFQFLITGTTSLSDFMLFLSFFLSVTMQLFMLSSGGTLLISCTSDTPFYLYMCNWEGGRLSINSPLINNPEDMEISSLNAKLPLWKHINYYPAGKDFCNKLRFMIMRSQRPLELNAMKFTIISLEGFSKILSSSMSYFALLKTFLEEEN